jgi:thioredoxin 1
MASANVKEFTNSNWESEVVKSEVPVLVDFWAPWCGPCRALTPAIDRIADTYAGRLKVGKLNTDEHQETAIKYGISSIPQVLIFRGGERPQRKVVGLTSERELTKLIDEVLQSA